MKTDTSAQWDKFFNRYYIGDILALANEYPEIRSLYVDFVNIEKFDPDLADELLAHPDQILSTAEEALRSFDLPVKKTLAGAHLRITDIPQKVKIRDLRSIHISKLIAIEGLVRMATEVRPRLLVAAFECNGCGETMLIPQSSGRFVEPYMCKNEGCGRKGPFKIKLTESEFVDAQKLRVQESPEDMRGGEQPQTLDVNIEDDIAGIVAPGDHVIVAGILRSYQRITREGKSTFFDIILDSVSIETKDKEFTEIEITPEEEEEIVKLSEDPEIYKKIIASIAPSIYGYEEVKEALALQLMSGIPKNLPDGARIRGDVHVLLVGDPGIAKSQLLRYIRKLAPRGIYTSGRSSSAAGLTAAAVRDEFGDGRWTLEAGALVLADQGIAAVDEMDKMRSEDRSAIHEAMEQQSYHPSTEIMFSDGRKVRMGEFVDTLIENNQDKTIDGVDCEILPFDGNRDLDDAEILTLDRDNNICQIPINRVSRHKAPDHFIRITYSNGRSITVTPEHPVYVVQNGEIITVLADELEVGAFAPIPTKYPLVSSAVALQIPDLRQREHDSSYTEISFPTHLDSDLGRLLGHIVSEGHVCYSEKNDTAEVMISNADLDIINDTDDLIRRTFDAATSISYRRHSVRKTANASADDEAVTTDLYTVRCASIPLYDFMKLNFEGVTGGSDENRIPDQIFVSYDDVKIEFLIGAFRGDCFYDSERFGYTTNSIGLANDYSDLLLCLGIYSCITSSDEYGSNRYKVMISGYGSRQKFYDVIGKHDLRNRKIKKCKSGRESKLNDYNRVSVDVAIRIRTQLKGYRLDHGHLNKTIAEKKGVHRKVALKYLNKVESYLAGIQPHDIDEMINPREIRKKYWIPTYLIAEQMHISNWMVTYIERNPSAPNATPLLEQVRRIAKANIEASREEVKDIKRIIESDIRFTTVRSVSMVGNDGFNWVYDVTVEPDHTFVSNGLILHNTVSIAKAGIMATLKSRCSLLGAANPKYGRFDPYEGIAQQIKMAPALLSRFDLIFVLKDEPDVGRDSAIASHILRAHHAGELHAHRTNVSGSGVTQADVEGAMMIIKPEIMPDLLRKYIAYSKRGVYPVMEHDAMDRLIEFYLGLRRQGEDRDSPVPVTARQLEALVRLCEASARLRLSYESTIEDAERVIRVVESCLRQVAFDAETGMFDADLITTGVSKSQRDKFKILRGIIRDIAAEHGGMASKDDICAMAEEQGFDSAHVEDMLGRLKTQGELYEPTQGNVRLS
ncbi:MAG: LAGLIDADG family homing endonuclease [Euryarchaeota archaeon]|nr:LAGLIDADG family homing endonuclease [Euryarchaeota archaeon]